MPGTRTSSCEGLVLAVEAILVFMLIAVSGLAIIQAVSISNLQGIVRHKRAQVNGLKQRITELEQVTYL